MYTSEFIPREVNRPINESPENVWISDIEGDVDKVLAACNCTRLPGVPGYPVLFALPQVEYDKLSRGGELVLTCEHGSIAVEYESY